MTVAFPPPRAGEAPARWAGFSLERPLIMGVLNVTPDSFSDGGDHAAADVAIAAGREMIAAGADIIDVGGESTRPGAAVVPPEVEQQRVLPVVRALAGEVPVSIDTRNAATMRLALEVGARIANDVSALRHDPEAARVVAAAGCAVVLMHMRGTPATMQSLARYGDVVEDVAAELGESLEMAVAAGIAWEAIALDPGIGFAKDAEQSLAVLAGLERLRRLGRPLLVGASRKSFIGHAAGEPDPRKRLAGGLAAHVWAVLHGAAIVRTHDVPQTRQALSVLAALQQYALKK